MINLTQGGLVVYGSLLAGGVALMIFVYKHRLPGLALADLIAPGVVLGVGLGRLGCFMNGCCYGGLSDVPWAVQFPAETPAYLDQVESHLVYLHGLQLAGAGNDPPVIEHVEPGSAAEKSGLRAGQQITAIDGVPTSTVDAALSYLLNAWGADRSLSIAVAGDPAVKRYRLATAEPLSLPVHPTQLYSFIDAVLLCLFLLAFEPFKRREGELTAIVLTLHPISRFLLEAIRIDESPVFGTGMSISQNISLAILVAGIGLWIYLLRRPAGSAWQGKPALAG
jgi:phosphatidylglycerol:prolipoprotein diacylglycerol transferase